MCTEYSRDVEPRNNGVIKVLSAKRCHLQAAHLKVEGAVVLHCAVFYRSRTPDNIFFSCSSSCHPGLRLFALQMTCYGHGVLSRASSPSGKLVQIEYALNAVAAGATSLGIKGGQARRVVKPCSVKQKLLLSQAAGARAWISHSNRCRQIPVTMNWHREECGPLVSRCSVAPQSCALCAVPACSHQRRRHCHREEAAHRAHRREISTCFWTSTAPSASAAPSLPLLPPLHRHYPHCLRCTVTAPIASAAPSLPPVPLLWPGQCHCSCQWPFRASQQAAHHPKGTSAGSDQGLFGSAPCRSF